MFGDEYHDRHLPMYHGFVFEYDYDTKYFELTCPDGSVYRCSSRDLRSINGDLNSEPQRRRTISAIVNGEIGEEMP